jgi:hypothetical protein
MMGVERAFLVISALGAFILLSGCGRLGASSRVDPISIAVYPGGKRPSLLSGNSVKCPFVKGIGSYSSGAVDLDCFRFPEDIRKGKNELAYERAVSKRRERNRLTSLLLKQSDDICGREMGQLTANEATVNASLNILATAATTAATIVTGEQAQKILAGSGTIATASRSHLNSDVYRNTVAYAISRAISLERSRIHDLLKSRYSDSTAEFTVDDAIRSANEYHGVCSFYKGLELVLASVEGDQRSRDIQARRAQINELEQQIRRYREQMQGLTGDAAKVFSDKIAELVDRIQAVTLAGIPVPQAEQSNEEEEQEQEQEQEQSEQ